MKKPKLRNTPEPLFVHGIQKTGTSTLVGILNSHPEVFLLYETRMDKTLISKYGNHLLKHLPEARPLFRDTPNIATPYLQLAELLYKKKPNVSYRYVGDKLTSLDAKTTQQTAPHKVIYLIRDVRTWLCKEQIVKKYRTDLDIVVPAVEYLRYYIESFKTRRALHLRLEDLITNNDQVLIELSKFLELDFSQYSQDWWNRIGKYSESDPKTFVAWYSGHVSSRVKPDSFDTKVTLAPHPFWDSFLPLFDKYFNSESKRFSTQSLNSDLQSLESFKTYAPVPLENAYSDILTQKFREATHPDPQPSKIIRLKKRIVKLQKKIGIK